MYTSLRKNLVTTVHQSWLETGFAWEQYNPETGAGQRTQHFTGWTSLVVEIMAMPDLSEKKGGHNFRLSERKEVTLARDDSSKEKNIYSSWVTS